MLQLNLDPDFFPILDPLFPELSGLAGIPENLSVPIEPITQVEKALNETPEEALSVVPEQVSSEKPVTTHRRQKRNQLLSSTKSDDLSPVESKESTTPVAHEKQKTAHHRKPYTRKAVAKPKALSQIHHQIEDIQKEMTAAQAQYQEAGSKQEKNKIAAAISRKNKKLELLRKDETILELRQENQELRETNQQQATELSELRVKLMEYEAALLASKLEIESLVSMSSSKVPVIFHSYKSYEKIQPNPERHMNGTLSKGPERACLN